VGAGALLLASPALADEPSLEAILTAVDDAGRQQASHAMAVMEVKTKRYERSMKMETWSQGTEKSLIRILEPAKDAGVTTLKVDENLWNYLPKVDRTMKVPAGMMSGAWMGSHLSNDDLVKEYRFSEDYDCALTSTLAAEPADLYVVACTPHEDTPVVWGRVEFTVRPDLVPKAQVFYDEDGVKVRTMSFEDVQDIDGQPTAMTFRIEPHDKQGEYTVFKYLELDLSPDLDDGMFSLQSLKK